MMRSVAAGCGLLMAMGLAGCGMVNPNTQISPPRNTAADSSNVRKGGSDTTKAQTIRVTPVAAMGTHVTVTGAKTGPGTIIKAVDGSVVTAPAGASVETSTEMRGLREADETAETREISNEGAGLSTNQKPPEGFSGGSITPGNLESGKTGGISAGTFRGAIKTTGAAWVFILGGLAVVVGVAAATVFKLTDGWYVAGAGAGLIVLGFAAPTYGGWILLVGLTGGVAYLAYYLYMHQSVVTNLVASVQNGVNALSAEAQAAWKSATSQKMDTTTKDVVKQTKVDEGIEESPNSKL